MKIYEIGTGYTSIPPKISAATEMVVKELGESFNKKKIECYIVDIEDINRLETKLPIVEVKMPFFLKKTDVSLGIMHKLKRVIYSISLSHVLKRIIKNSSEKVVFHFHNQYNLFFFLLLSSSKVRNNCYIVYTNHSGIWSLPLDESLKTLKKKYFQEIYCMKMANVVFALNKEMKNNIVSFCNILEDKVKVIANGVNTDVYKPLEKTKLERVLKKYNLVDKNVILQVGSVYENKGQIRSIQALAKFLQKHDLYYAFAGGIVDQKYYDSIFEIAKELDVEDRVIYLGMINPGKELCEVYNCANYTILSSKYEGFCLVGIESMSCGIPVIVNNTPFEYGTGSIDIDSFLKNDKVLPSASESKAARDNVLNNYTWDTISNQYFDVFNGVNKK